MTEMAGIISDENSFEADFMKFAEIFGRALCDSQKSFYDRTEDKKDLIWHIKYDLKSFETVGDIIVSFICFFSPINHYLIPHHNHD